MYPVTEQELAKMESEYNTAWQQAVDLYLLHVKKMQTEIETLINFGKAANLPGAVMFLAVVGMKLHLAIGQQTGQMLDKSDTK